MKKYIIITLLISVLFACSQEPDTTDQKDSLQVFEKLDNKIIGLEFNNEIIETAQINYYKYVYLYNGGGVGIGDINNDGLPDVYMTSTMGVDKLFLNLGGLKFKDISSIAGINKYSGHKTGVTFTDINNDGWLDIYVCRSSWTKNPQDLSNLLFINNKDNTFSEQAASYGLDDISHSVQSVFFDYDRDGDNDLYLSNQPGEFRQLLTDMIKKINNPEIQFSDKLYRNDGNNKFTDVTESSGVMNYGYGLGITATDFNNDGFIDIYVSNDFAPHDYYYVNQGDGTFKESLQEYFPHCSYFSMGLDVCDINDDGYQDLFVVEMLSEDNVRQKTNMAPMDMDKFDFLINSDLHYQFMRNVFQINNGNGYFSDIAYYSGIDKTDWSWGTLFGDYDNDGDNDLIVVNGYLRDTQDKDFSTKSNKIAEEKNNRLTFDEAYSMLQSTRLSNYVFRYDGNYKFRNMSSEWGFDFSGYSNGVAYGDLDLDGDLDIIVNNVNDQAGVYENKINNSRYVGFKLIGTPENQMGLNAKLELHTNLKTHYREFQVTRGFQSSCDPNIHFGLSDGEIPDSLIVFWTDKERESYFDIQLGQYQNIKYNKPSTFHKVSEKAILNLTHDKGLNFEHQEIIYDDYTVEILLPHKLSQLGPALAIGDVDNNGLDDVFIGGAHQQAGQVFLQLKTGSFKSISNDIWQKDKSYEDIDAVFFDADSNGTLDLYVVSGSNEFLEDQKMLEDRLYLNDGKGNFSRSINLLPEFFNSGGCVAPNDMDNDGDIDLFIGGRLMPGQYPNPASSYLLENTSDGFKIVTDQHDESLSSPGMINDAIWTDFNGDDIKDLILVGEWTDIQFYAMKDNRLEHTQVLNKPYVGWWNCIKASDIDNDGDLDYILGNLGENYKYQATDERPFEVYAGDFDGNNRQDIVVGYYSNDKLYPVRGLQCSSEQIPEIKKKFPSYKAFGEAGLHEIYGSSLDDALNYKANIFSSVVMLNNGNSSFIIKSLPVEVQLSPVQDIIVSDINNDSLPDIITAGNWFVSEIETPRADNGTGTILINKGNAEFESMPTLKSGFFANKDVRKLALINSNDSDNKLIIVANNNDKVQIFSQLK